jgi:Domain of unknown function (DUF1942)
MVSVGAVAPASAASNTQVVGIEESLAYPNGEIAYTVTKIVPSGDPVAFPITGQLYEASVMARVNHGTVAPVVPNFSARAGSGANYPVLPNVSTLSGAPLNQGTTTDGKIYFDVVGEAPDSVVYKDGAEELAWTLPTSGESAAAGSGGGSGSTDGGGGSEGVTGSTGPNEASPDTSGGEIGGGEGGTEGGGGNLDSGGGSGAPSGDTG